jgi:polysaccharide export outer membrane protein
MRRILLSLCLLVSLTAAGQAQDIEATRALATRTELQQALDTMPASQRNGPVGAAIKKRLTDGDFTPGERVQISVVADSSLSGTFVVRPDGTIIAPNIEPISLRGVLRSEIETYLQEQLKKYLRDPKVTARALIRVSVAGEVARPGFYDLPPESAASDVIVTAGGLAPAGDPQRVVVRRSGMVLYDKEQVREFFVRGASLDQMGIQTGDEFGVGRRSSTNLLPIIGAITGIAFAIAAFAQLF